MRSRVSPSMPPPVRQELSSVPNLQGWVGWENKTELKLLPIHQMKD